MTTETNAPDAAMLWRDIADMPENQPVLAKFRAWNKPDGEQMQHVVWLFEGKVRLYPKTDEEAYADAWKPLPGQAHERRADAGLLAALERSTEGWANALELGLIPERHRNTAEILAEEGRAAITAAKGHDNAEG